MRSLKKTLTSACLFLIALLAVLWLATPNRAAPAPQPTTGAPSQRFGDLQKAEDPSFRKHVVPLLARSGCSGRECHGSFQGRGGFQLSLFGSEWEQDFVALTQKKGDEGETHIDLTAPEKSLILMKPTMQTKHKGKERFKKDSWQYNVILKWIQGGAKNDADKTGELQKLEVTPSELIFARIGQTIQLRVLAHWADGATEDVTEITRFKTNDEAVATVSDSGLVTCVGKGDSHVVASYDNGVLPVPMMLPVSEFVNDKYPTQPARTKIDEVVLTKLRKVGIVPAEVCNDAEFLRRVSLDLTGTLPTPEQVTAFTTDTSAGKRSAKIDELIKTPAYSAWWTTKFCDYTGNSPRQLNNISAGGNNNRNPGEVSRQWYEWLYKRVAANQPYDKMVADIVMATSRSSSTQTYKEYVLETNTYFRSDHPADYADHPTLAYFWQRRNSQTPEEKALAFSHTFLGVRLECAQCHKHPFDRWTKTDFKQFTAFFGPITASQRPAMGGEEVTYQSLVQEMRTKAMKEVDAEMGPSEMMDGMDMKKDDAKGKADAKDGKAPTKGEKLAANIALPDGASKTKGDEKDAKGAAKDAKSESVDAKTEMKLVKGEAKDTKDGKAADVKLAKTDAKDAKPEVKPGTIDPKTGKLVKVLKPDQKRQQALQRALQAETKRRIDAGEPVPWQEVWVNSKNVRTTGKGATRFDPSVTPKILGGETMVAGQFPDSRQPLVDWLRSKSNPYFAKAIVNRVWATYFNRGIVDPPDDMNIANAPSNTELLNYLAEGFTEHGYDMQWLHREILNSDTYQRSWKTNPTNALDTRNFSHAVVRQLPAEVMLDAIDMAIASTNKLVAFTTEMDTRAIGPAGTSLYGGKGGKGNNNGDGYFLNLFGKPSRETNCDCERSTDPTLLQTLFTRNDPTLLGRIDGQGWIGDIRKSRATLDTDKAITEVFLRTVSRLPTSDEMNEARTDIAAAKTPVDGVRDLLWAMINTREFRVNH